MTDRAVSNYAYTIRWSLIRPTRNSIIYVFPSKTSSARTISKTVSPGRNAYLPVKNGPTASATVRNVPRTTTAVPDDSRRDGKLATKPFRYRSRPPGCGASSLTRPRPKPRGARPRFRRTAEIRRAGGTTARKSRRLSITGAGRPTGTTPRRHDFEKPAPSCSNDFSTPRKRPVEPRVSFLTFARDVPYIFHSRRRRYANTPLHVRGVVPNRRFRYCRRE